jgi:hypothetical protein
VALKLTSSDHAAAAIEREWTALKRLPAGP